MSSYLDGMAAYVAEVVGITAAYRRGHDAASEDVTVVPASHQVDPLERATEHGSVTVAAFAIAAAQLAERPRRGATITIASGVWSGTWTLQRDAEPGGAGEWLCHTHTHDADHTMLASRGAPRRRAAP